MKQTDPQLKLRLPPRLMEQVRKSADGNRKTLSAEIIARLEWTFAQSVDALPVPTPSTDLAVRVLALEDEMQSRFMPLEYLQQEMSDVLERLHALENPTARKPK